jgi:hypothetical protein
MVWLRNTEHGTLVLQALIERERQFQSRDHVD